MPRDMPVRSLMTTDVLSFAPSDDVTEAMTALVERSIDAAPVVGASGEVVGILSSSDLIIEESRFHFPTVFSILGADIELPRSKRRFEQEITKAFASTVGEVMAPDPVLIGPDDTIEDAATLMHTKDVSRLPVVDDDGQLVGIISRGDVLRAIVMASKPQAPGADGSEGDAAG